MLDIEYASHKGMKLSAEFVDGIGAAVIAERNGDVIVYPMDAVQAVYPLKVTSAVIVPKAKPKTAA